jgi:broad specificity phosphatase PhoE
LDWGDITVENRAAIEAERYAVGVLNYAFPGGDNTPDYAEAIDRFVHETFRGRSSAIFPECVVVLTHGFALRLIARSVLRIGDEEFRSLANPPNCYCSEIRYDAGSDSFSLLAPLPITERRRR